MLHLSKANGLKYLCKAMVGGILFSKYVPGEFINISDMKNKDKMAIVTTD